MDRRGEIPVYARKPGRRYNERHSPTAPRKNRPRSSHNLHQDKGPLGRPSERTSWQVGRRRKAKREYSLVPPNKQTHLLLDWQGNNTPEPHEPYVEKSDPMLPFIQAHTSAWWGVHAKRAHEWSQKNKKDLGSSPDTMFASSSEKLATTHKLKMGCRKSRPHAAVHTGAHISLVRCTRHASTRVVAKKKQDLGSSPDTMFAFSSEKLATTHKLKMHCRKSTFPYVRACRRSTVYSKNSLE